MGAYQYEWWDVEILYTTGKYTFEVKARDRDHAIKAILKEARTEFAKEVYWDTLKLDHVGYQRLF